MLPDVIRVVPQRHRDARGYFIETWRADEYADAGIDAAFVQENLSFSAKGTLRAIHYQVERPQGRLVRVVDGAVFDVAVDLRKSSPTFGQWTGEVLSSDNRHQIWVPPGFGHGFLVLTETATFEYNCTEFYAPEFDRCVRWNDADIGIDWPLEEGQEPLISDKDMAAPAFKDADTYS